jgi:hypothetical protein
MSVVALVHLQPADAHNCGERGARDCGHQDLARRVYGARAAEGNPFQVGAVHGDHRRALADGVQHFAVSPREDVGRHRDLRLCLTPPKKLRKY